MPQRRHSLASTSPASLINANSKDRYAVRLGRVDGDTVHLGDRFGGGTVSLDELRNASSRFWNEYGDMSNLTARQQVDTVSSVIERVRSGEQFTAGNARQMAAAGARGAAKGANAISYGLGKSTRAVGKVSIAPVKYAYTGEFFPSDELWSLCTEAGGEGLGNPGVGVSATVYWQNVGFLVSPRDMLVYGDCGLDVSVSSTTGAFLGISADYSSNMDVNGIEIGAGKGRHFGAGYEIDPNSLDGSLNMHAGWQLGGVPIYIATQDYTEHVPARGGE